MAEQGREAQTEALTLQHIAVKAASRARAEASRAEGDDQPRLQAEAIAAANLTEALSLGVVHSPRLVADDVTPAAAGSLLAEQGGRLAIFSAEGGIFDTIAGRYYGNVPAMDLWLKGHSGDPVKVDRKDRQPLYIPSPALTISLMIQPNVLASIGRDGRFRGRGLLARFLYCEPESKVGRRKAGADPVPGDVITAYGEAVSALVEGLSGWGTDPAMVQLTPEAAQGVLELEAHVEHSLAGDGDLATLADWGAKFVGAIVRIAGLLHFARYRGRWDKASP